MHIAKEVLRIKDFYPKARTLSQKIIDAVCETEQINISSFHTIVKSIMQSAVNNQDALLCLKTPQRPEVYDFIHPINVAALAIIFGKFLGYDEEQQYMLGLAGALHDIGKQFIPLSISNAPRRLNPDEIQAMQTHPVRGYEALQKLPYLSEEVRLAVLHHHEKFDGTGYPSGRKGTEIPPMAAIIGLIDTYDAMSNNHVYRKAVTPIEAVTSLFSLRNTAFDPGLVEQFIKCIGMYPAGSFVKLSSGEFGVVCENNQNMLKKPRVLAFPCIKGRFIMSEARMVNLHESGLTIRSFGDPAEYKFDAPNAIIAWAIHNT